MTDNSRALKKELDLKEHEIKLSQQKLESGPFASTIKSFRERSERVSELEKLIKESSETEKKGNMEIKRIEKEMSEFNSNKSGKLKELEVCCFFFFVSFVIFLDLLTFFSRNL